MKIAVGKLGARSMMAGRGVMASAADGAGVGLSASWAWTGSGVAELVADVGIE